jgi:hypothetical protein
MGRYNGTCCHEDNPNFGNTGCPVGYTCEYEANDSDNVKVPVCVGPSNHRDPLTKILPRYHLCRIPVTPNNSGRAIHGLPVKANNQTTTSSSSSTTTRKASPEVAKLAYYSSHGPIENIYYGGSQQQKIDMVLIVIHGANRNGDDYFCSGLSTVSMLQQQQQEDQHNDNDFQPKRDFIDVKTEDNVLVIAPIFYGNTDKKPAGVSFLYWDVESDEDGPWRYGADAMGPVPGISSFDALDQLIMTVRIHVFQQHLDQLSNEISRQQPYQNKRNMITIAGHSSGGQMVQRWSLLTSSTIWPPEAVENDDEDDNVRRLRVRAVVANPSSYVYLTPLRLINGRWLDPSKTSRKRCDMYNQWEWGLDDGGPYDVPYRRRALHGHTRNSTSSDDASPTIERVIARYKHDRQVVYLIGDRDRCNVSSESSSLYPSGGWCDSHGLETTCMDEVQGSNRYERNERFVISLSLPSPLTRSNTTATKEENQTKAITLMMMTMKNEIDVALNEDQHRHRRIVVPNVGHDHTMMFQSRQGLSALYSETLDGD